MLKKLFLTIGVFMANFVGGHSEIKAIIFDCDGTLVDSEELHFHAWRETLRNFGGELTMEDYLSYVGKSGEAVSKLLAERINRLECAEEIFSQKRALFLESLEEGIPPIEGTVNFAHRLAKERTSHNLKLAVASATVKKEVLLNLKNLGLENAFDVILSGHDDLIGYEDPEGVNKPKPYIYLHTAKLLGVSPSECVVIEDSHTGVSASANAGCITVAVPSAYSKNQDLSRATMQLETLEDFTVESFLELLENLKSPN